MHVNVAMWRKALQVIPRISREEWQGLDIISRWLIAARSAVLVMTFLSSALAGILALRAGQFNLVPWLLLTVGLILAHAANNLINDLVDHWQGVDKDNYFRTQYGPQPLEHGLLNARQMILYAAVTGLIALAAGAYLVYLRGGLALALLAIGAVFVLFYTWPLKYIGLGEPAVLVVWGPLMVGGGYYVVTGAWDWNVVIASLPYALGVTTVLFGKHIDKIEADTQKTIRTLPVLLGERNARYAVIGMVVLQYLFTVYLVATGFFTPAMLVVFLALTAFRTLLGVYLQPRPASPPPEYSSEGWPLWFVSFAFWHNRRFGALYLLGLILDVIVIRVI